MMAEPLHRLPNGEWGELTGISQISPYPAVFTEEPNRLVIVHDGTPRTLVFADFSETLTCADELAKLVNAARAGRERP